MPTCEELPLRQREICEGRAALPLPKINAYRAMWGLPPLAVPAQRHVPSVIHGVSHKGGCGGCGPAGGAPRGDGPGTRLMRKWKKLGAPQCSACAELAASMDQWGPAGCRERLDQIVEDILPRARNWMSTAKPWAHAVLGAIRLEDAALRYVIRRDIEKAIRESETERKTKTAAQSRDPDLRKELETLASNDPETPEDELAARKIICQECPLAANCSASRNAHLRASACPYGLWHPAVNEPMPFTAPIRRNIVMHFLPVSGNGIWQRHCQWLADRWPLFNGRRIVAIIQADGRDAGRTSRKPIRTDAPEEVLAEFRRRGVNWDEVLVLDNVAAQREVASFAPLIERVVSDDPNDVTFYCQTKAVTHDPGSICLEWAETMYHVCLDDWPSIERALTRHAMIGPFRRFGQFRTTGNHRWHYSGTFFWIRHALAFRDDWQRIDKQFFGVESWPGLHFSPAECVCIFADKAPDLYQVPNWEERIRPELAAWNLVREHRDGNSSSRRDSNTACSEDGRPVR